MFDFEAALQLVAEQSVLCVGDVMLDDFVYGEVTRVSPEAPAPVLAVGRSELEIGGAGNVARNVASLGAQCIFVGLIGDDEAGLMLRKVLGELIGVRAALVVESSRQTTRKVRFVSEHYSTHLMRADWETAVPASAASQDSIIAHAEAAMARAGAVVLSDYGKGALTERVIRAIIGAARKLGKSVIVDPKGHDYRVYRGATLITPNAKELAAAVHRPITTEPTIEAAAAELARLVDCDAVLVKRSEAGMSLHVNGHSAVHIPAYPVKVRDVSGAGDTVVAAMAVLLAAGAPYELAMRAANAAAAVAVGKRGTATVSFAEWRHRILPAASLAPEDKIVFDWSELDERLGQWRHHGLRVGFTNGCFDLIHRGHIRLLAGARAACDRLVVGLNSDASTARLKGQGRPINAVEGRAEILAALEAVDVVVVFEEDTPLELIRRVRPTVLVKGADYRRDEVVGRQLVEAAGGQVVLIDLVPDHSTTKMIRRINPVTS